MKQIAIFVLCLGIFQFAQTQTFVDLNAAGANNGSSWTDAYTDLQTAIDSTASGEIWVAQGLYVPSDSDLTVSFVLKDNIQLYGGFDGQETTLAERDYLNNLTILSGDMGQDDLNPIADTTTDIVGQNSLHVVVVPGGLGPNAILDGFVITAGTANGASIDGRGAGLICFSTINPNQFYIRNCLFQGNESSDRGGGASLSGQGGIIIDYTFENCSFRNNTALGTFGGGLYSAGGSSGGQHKPLITRCSFFGNFAETLGGGDSNDRQLNQ